MYKSAGKKMTLYTMFNNLGVKKRWPSTFLTIVFLAEVMIYKKLTQTLKRQYKMSTILGKYVLASGIQPLNHDTLTGWRGIYTPFNLVSQINLRARGYRALEIAWCWTRRVEVRTLRQTVQITYLYVKCALKRVALRSTICGYPLLHWPNTV